MVSPFRPHRRLRFTPSLLPPLHFSRTQSSSAEPLRSGSQSFAYETNAELKRLIKSDRLADARLLFDGMPYPDEVSWTTIMSGYVGASEPREALSLFSLMRASTAPDPFVLSVALKACASETALRPHGESLHAYTLKSGALACSVFVGTALLDMYSKTGDSVAGLRVFDEMPLRNVVSWTGAVAALVRAGRCRDAVRCFAEMRTSGVPCDSHTYAVALKACADAGWLARGREVHAQAAKLGLVAVPFVANTLANMYTKCHRLQDSLLLLDQAHSRDVVAWTTIISGYVQSGLEEEALRSFARMRDDQSEAAGPNEYTYAAVISACVGLGHLKPGEQVHAHVIRRGFVSAMSVCNALVTLYARVGLLESAEEMFREATIKDIVSWSAIISAYAQEGRAEESFKLFDEMARSRWPRPNEFTLSSLLSLCAFTATLDAGRQLHARALLAGLDREAMVTSALITMYSKCGSLEEAAQAFDCRSGENVVSWTAMINGYAEHGRSTEAINLFDEMQHEARLQPDGVAFIGVLTACCHAGKVNLGLRYFESMKTEHGLRPGKEHYGCIVDLLGRVGRVKDAEKVIREMPRGEADGVVWTALMRACASRGDEEGGRRAAAKVKELEPWGAGAHIVMANLYAGKGSWREAAKERKMLREKGVRKEAGWSWVGVGRQGIGVFVAGDRSHERMEETYEMLDLVYYGAKMAGYDLEFETDQVWQAIWKS